MRDDDSLPAPARIWNRAALDGRGPFPRAGDRALAALLYCHGYVMNGGVDHACECLTAKELQLACEGYRRYGLEDVADLLVAAPRDERTDDSAYARSVPSDSALGARFEADLAAHPSDYAPADPSDASN